jgi:hypothetical protein
VSTAVRARAANGAAVHDAQGMKHGGNVLNGLQRNKFACLRNGCS